MKKIRKYGMISLILGAFVALTIGSSPSVVLGQAVFPGKFFVVDRAALYDDSIENELVNGDFELEQPGGVPGWEFDPQSGAPSAEVVPGGSDGGKMLRVTTTVTVAGPDTLCIRSTPVAVAPGAERYALSFKVRTDFAVIDESWGDDLAVVANLRWHENGTWKIDPNTWVQTKHSLYAWRPVFAEMAVPAGAEAVQVQFKVSGNVPNADANAGDAPHMTYLDEIRLLAIDEEAPSLLALMPVAGEATLASAESSQFLGSTEDGRYYVSATFQPDSSGVDSQGVVEGVVTNQTTREAAVDLIFAVDVDGTDGRISYDISRGERMGDSDGRYYEDPISADWYSTLTMSAVPLGSVTTTDGTH